jgi:hypothetical protein
MTMWRISASLSRPTIRPPVVLKVPVVLQVLRVLLLRVLWVRVLLVLVPRVVVPRHLRH